MTNASKKAPIFKFNLLGTRRLFKDRLELLCAIAQQLPAQCQLPWLAFIRRLVESELPNIRVPVDEAPEVGVGRSGRIEILRGNPSKFRISDQFCQLLLHLKTQLKLDAQHFNDVIDNFILHELVHRGQGFEEGGHRGLAQRAARVLDSLDYQADAWAVLIHFSLANIAPEKFGAIGQSRWNLYARLIRAVLYQMYLFRLSFSRS